MFAIGEGVLLSGSAAGPAGSVPSLAADTALWGTALLLVSLPTLFAAPVRIVGIVSALLFMITSARILSGRAAASDRDTAAKRRLSAAGCHLHRLDLDVVAREDGRSKLKSQGRFCTIVQPRILAVCPFWSDAAGIAQ